MVDEYKFGIEKVGKDQWDPKKLLLFAILVIVFVTVPVYLLLSAMIIQGSDIAFKTGASSQYLLNTGMICEPLEISLDEAWYMCNGRPYYISFGGSFNVIQQYDGDELNLNDVNFGFGYISDLDGYTYYKSRQTGDNIELYFYNLDQGKKYVFDTESKTIISSSEYNFISELQGDFNMVYSASCTVDGLEMRPCCGTASTSEYLVFNVTCDGEKGASTIISLSLIPPFLVSGDISESLSTSFRFAFPNCVVTSSNETDFSVIGSCSGFDVKLKYIANAPSTSISFTPTTMTIQELINHIVSHPALLFSQQDMSSVDFELTATIEDYAGIEACTMYQYMPFALHFLVCENEIKWVMLCASGQC